MDGYLMAEYALMAVDGLDVEDFRYGQMLTVFVGLSAVTAGRMVWLVGECIITWCA